VLQEQATHRSWQEQVTPRSWQEQVTHRAEQEKATTSPLPEQKTKIKEKILYKKYMLSFSLQEDSC
jgi:acyl carrier protein phosphodiesterase